NYLEKIPAEKIILAVPYYGYDWPKNSSASILSYSEIANSSKNSKISWDETTQTPFYNYSDDNDVEHVVHFDNVRSLGIKYDFVNKKDLKGIGIWALGYDGQNQELKKLIVDKFSN
ncbi:MAG: glycosyl hydrolase family 18 protein, partial [Actinobacteria bacterium]|nr:glycosyl hydrolase family 18 protein [Actinomycetota bacterium]